VIPFLFCLLPNKTQDTYQRALHSIFMAMDNFMEDEYRPETIILDFEKAEEMAFRNLVAGIYVHGCLFHFRQAVFKNIQQKGLQQQYIENANFRRLIKKFAALTFCDVADVKNRYVDLAIEMIQRFGDTEENQNFLEYFENTWTGRLRRNPRFSIEMWNSRHVTEINLPRTTNSLESWHNILAKRFSCRHPNFFKFVEGIIQEESHANTVINNYNY
jgi:hypothetical protein